MAGSGDRVIVGTWFVVSAGLVGAILLGLGMAFDATAVMMLGFIAFFGGIGLGVAEKTRRGAVSPATCPECSGLLSPNAPYCKHCGARL